MKIEFSNGVQITVCDDDSWELPNYSDADFDWAKAVIEDAIKGIKEDAIQRRSKATCSTQSKSQMVQSRKS